MPMKNPPHPGRIVRQECLEPLGLSVTDGAKALGVSRNALSELVNERRGVSAEMAIRLAKAFGSTPEAWARIQLDYDMAQAMKRADEIKVQRVPTPGFGAE
jgi:addiction module HigA family antidote